MHQLFNFPTKELEQEDTIFITIVQELHAVSLTDDKDRIQFDNLLSQAEKEIKETDLEEKQALLDQLELVERERNELVNHSGALAIYITSDDFYYYHLGVPVTDQIFINHSPYILPLAENYQYSQDYHVLAISREHARIFEGHGTHIQELDMTEKDEDAPTDFDTVFEGERKGGDLSFGTYDAGHGQAGTQQFFHGHGETSQEKDIDRERYFRAVDEFVYEHYSNETEWPLLLFTVEDNYAMFKEISHNNFLSDVKIEGSATNLSDAEIKDQIADKINHLLDKQKEELLDELDEVTPANRIENIPDDLTAASQQGQINILYLEKGFEIPGTINEDGFYDREDEQDNFIQLLINNVIKTGGKVYVFDPDDMPEDTQIVARLRF